MHIPKLANIATIWRAILDGKQVQVVVTIKEAKPVSPPAPTYIPTCGSSQHSARICVQTNRKGTGRWARIPFEIPEGYYQTTFNRSR